MTNFGHIFYQRPAGPRADTPPCSEPPPPLDSVVLPKRLGFGFEISTSLLWSEVIENFTVLYCHETDGSNCHTVLTVTQFRNSELTVQYREFMQLKWKTNGIWLNCMKIWSSDWKFLSHTEKYSEFWDSSSDIQTGSMQCNSQQQEAKNRSLPILVDFASSDTLPCPCQLNLDCATTKRCMLFLKVKYRVMKTNLCRTNLIDGTIKHRRRKEIPQHHCLLLRIWW